MSLPQYYIATSGFDTVYLQGKPNDYTIQGADSVVDSYQRSKNNDAMIMSIPASDEDQTMVMTGLSGTTGKIMLTGTATASTPDDVSWFCHHLDMYCNAEIANTITFYDGLRDWNLDVAITSVSYDIHAGNVYIIKWKIDMTLGTIIGV